MKKIKVSVYGTDRSVEPFDNKVNQDFVFNTEEELEAFLRGLRLGVRSSTLYIKEVEGEREWKT